MGGDGKPFKPMKGDKWSIADQFKRQPYFKLVKMMISTFPGLDGDNIDLEELDRVRSLERSNPANLSKNLMSNRVLALDRIYDSLTNTDRIYEFFDWRIYHAIAIDNLERQRIQLEEQMPKNEKECDKEEKNEEVIESAAHELQEGNIDDRNEIKRLQFLTEDEFNLTEEQLRMKVHDTRKSLLANLLYEIKDWKYKIEYVSGVDDTIFTEEFAKDKIYDLYCELYKESEARDKYVHDIYRIVQGYIEKDSALDELRMYDLIPMKKKVDFYVKKILEMKAKELITENDTNYPIFVERLAEFRAVQEDLAEAIKDPVLELEKEMSLKMESEYRIELDKFPLVHIPSEGFDHGSDMTKSSVIVTVSDDGEDSPVKRVKRRGMKRSLNEDSSDSASVDSKISKKRM